MIVHDQAKMDFKSIFGLMNNSVPAEIFQFIEVANCILAMSHSEVYHVTSCVYLIFSTCQCADSILMKQESLLAAHHYEPFLVQKSTAACKFT